MPEQNIPVGEMPRVTIDECNGALVVEGWDRAEIQIEADHPLEGLRQEGDTVAIGRTRGDVTLRLPNHAELSIARAREDMEISAIGMVEIGHLRGDLELRSIVGPVTLRQIDGHLEINGAGDVTVEAPIGGHAEIENITGAITLGKVNGNLEVEAAEALTVSNDINGHAVIKRVISVDLKQVHGHLELDEVQNIAVRRVQGNCEAEQIGELLRYGAIDGHLELRGNGVAVISGGNVGGDVEVDSVGSLHIGALGGNAEVEHVAGEVTIGSLGGDAEMQDIGGSLSLGQVGGNAEIKSLRGGLRSGYIGGNLELDADFPAGSSTRLVVGGNAEIDLPAAPNLSIRGTVGGSVSGDRLVSRGGHGVIAIVYGEGAAQLNLMIGGNLELSGGGSPRSSSSTSGDWAAFESEMDQLGADIGQIGEEIGRTTAAAFAGWGSFGDDWSQKMARKAKEMERKVEAQAKRAEAQARRAEERAQRAEERQRAPGDAGASWIERAPERFRVRINDREWVFDRERLEHLKVEAARAAREGVTGAMQAIDRAMAGMGVPPDPNAPSPPPAPPRPPTPPPYTGQTVRIDIEEASEAPSAPTEQAAAPEVPPAAVNADEERAAILRMIAEGRISPEEGDMLLDALG